MAQVPCCFQNFAFLNFNRTEFKGALRPPPLFQGSTLYPQFVLHTNADYI